LEDSWLEAAYEDRFEPAYDAFDHPFDPPVDTWDDEDDEDDYDPYEDDVDDDFPMSLEYEGPFGLSGYDEY